ncbi:hypothetical protein XELAEV_18008197mg [Xenopus laevis]|uniref:Uncharacterized protein n=1 Tax=Xenopus laevis TaxID=8355 RepID=A0A974E2J8_XENLA|nr:hypothetical protein XELAEV_18008197mg [Xenopus laevis]
MCQCIRGGGEKEELWLLLTSGSSDWPLNSDCQTHYRPIRKNRLCCVVLCCALPCGRMNHRGRQGEMPGVRALTLSVPLLLQHHWLGPLHDRAPSALSCVTRIVICLCVCVAKSHHLSPVYETCQRERIIMGIVFKPQAKGLLRDG